MNRRSQTSEMLHFYYLSIASLWMDRTNYVPTPIEWNLIQDAYDEKYKRRADMAFLFGYVMAQTLRGSARRRWISWRSFYCGLVGYDLALADINPCPSMNCWNALVMLNSPLGEFARSVYAPVIFHQCPSRPSLFHTADTQRRSSSGFFGRVTHAALAVSRALLLQNVLSSFFEGSLWQSPSSIRGRFPQTPDAVAVSATAARDESVAARGLLPPIHDPSGRGKTVHRTFALVMNFRSLRWCPIMTTYHQLSDVNHEYGFVCTPFPSIPDDRRELWSTTLDCAGDLLSSRTRLLAGTWWWVHSFAMMLILGYAT